MKSKNIHFSSDSNEWETPQELFDQLNKEFHFQTDVAASKKNHKCRNYFTQKNSALKHRWAGNCFCNPPYGRELSKFVRKAYEESQKAHSGTIVLLIPARTDTKIWHDCIFDKAEIRFLKGRIKFNIDGTKKDNAPFPSAIVIYR
ncbi:phage N-6-adenine-methyltransferase [Listeria ilorinensis]|uniref:phage N-6-adenine-methyltransferase n=1 Tax=Listeria ilorinensis TaxID=2867439 RepID=UPI001EF66679|nr:phage N-6-adenine-methyltransferase [Listeria ilorinensis]